MLKALTCYHSVTTCALRTKEEKNTAGTFDFSSATDLQMKCKIALELRGIIEQYLTSLYDFS